MVRISVSPAVARKIEELNAAFGNPPDAPCDERNIECFVAEMDADEALAEQMTHLKTPIATAFLEVYSALASLPFNVARRPLASLAILADQLNGLTAESQALRSLEEMDGVMNALQAKVASSSLAE